MLLDQAPELDGDIDGDPAWSSVPVASGFLSLGTRETPSHSTHFLIAYTTSCLYAAFVCQEPDLDDIIADMDDGEELWDEDSIELFISTDGEHELQFVVSPVGSRSSPVTLRDWRAETALGKDQWRVEVEIPWGVIGHVPSPVGRWRVNVCRNILSEGEIERATWSAVGDGFHEPWNFRSLKFSSLSPPRVEAIRARVAKGRAEEDVLVFSRPKSGVLMQGEGPPKRVLFSQGDHVRPRLSPDGTRLLYTSEEGGRTGVWTLQLETGKKERICDGRQGEWSPDGLRVVLCRQGRIIERRLFSGEERPRTRVADGVLAYPSYMPSGSVLCTDVERGRLAVLKLFPRRRIVRLPPESVSGPGACSPDRKHIAFASGRHVFLYSLNGRHTSQLTFAGGYQSQPVWDRDAGGLVYLQTPNWWNRVGEVYHVSLSEPSYRKRIERNVYDGFDWAGIAASPGRRNRRTSDRPALRLWNTGPRGRGHVEMPPSQRAWREIAIAPKRRLPPCTLAEAQWGSVWITPEGVSVRSEASDDGDGVVDVTFAFGTRHKTSTGKTSQDRAMAVDTECRIVGVSLVTGTPETMELSFNLRDATGSRGKASLFVGVGMPGVLVSAPGSTTLAVVSSAFEHVVCPDRLGDDLVVSASQSGTELRVMPRTSAVLGLCRGGGVACLVAARGGPTHFGLWKADDQRDTSIVVPFRHSGAVAVAPVTGSPVWKQSTLRQDNGGPPTTRYYRPFAAVWRQVVWTPQSSWSRLWDEDQLDRTVARTLPVPAEYGSHAKSLIYLFDRLPATPLDQLTPVDLVLEGPGVDPLAVDWLDPRAWTYRSDPELSFPELATRELGWAPWMAHNEKQGFGVLDVMSGIFAAGTPGTKTYTRRLGLDAIRLITHAQERILAFHVALAEIPETNPDGNESRRFMKTTATRARKALSQFPIPATTDVEACRRALNRLVEGLGTEDGGLSSADALYDKEPFTEFSRRCRESLDMRRPTLTGLRRATRSIRTDAGRMLLSDPAGLDAYDTIRDWTRRILWLRDYAEGDWRGEVPTADTDVSPRGRWRQ